MSSSRFCDAWSTARWCVRFMCSTVVLLILDLYSCSLHAVVALFCVGGAVFRFGLFFSSHFY